MPRPWPLAPALTALGGAAVGFVLAAATAVPARSPSASAPPPLEVPRGEDPNLAALLAEVRALGDRIERLAAPRAAGAAAPSERTALPADSPGDVAGPAAADVTRLLDRCTQLLERLERRTDAGAGPRRLAPAPPTASPASLEALDYTDKALDERLTREHQLVDYQGVLDRYGKPDAIWNSRDSIKVKWSYQLVLKSGDRHDVTFEFIDGMVSRVYE